nr:hypothetical protein CFP56_09279 [Quercus suber]
MLISQGGAGRKLTSGLPFGNKKSAGTPTMDSLGAEVGGNGLAAYSVSASDEGLGVSVLGVSMLSDIGESTIMCVEVARICLEPREKERYGRRATMNSIYRLFRTPIWIWLWSHVSLSAKIRDPILREILKPQLDQNQKLIGCGSEKDPPCRSDSATFRMIGDDRTATSASKRRRAGKSTSSFRAEGKDWLACSNFMLPQPFRGSGYICLSYLRPDIYAQCSLQYCLVLYICYFQSSPRAIDSRASPFELPQSDTAFRYKSIEDMKENDQRAVLIESMATERAGEGGIGGQRDENTCAPKLDYREPEGRGAQGQGSLALF